MLRPCVNSSTIYSVFSLIWPKTERAILIFLLFSVAKFLVGIFLLFNGL